MGEAGGEAGPIKEQRRMCTIVLGYSFMKKYRDCVIVIQAGTSLAEIGCASIEISLYENLKES